MSIWNIIIISVSKAVTAILIFVRLQSPAITPQSTTLDIQPSGQVTVDTTQTLPTAPVITPKTPQVTILPQEPAITIPAPETTPEPTPPSPPEKVYIPVVIIQDPTPVTAPEPIIEPKKHMITLEIFGPSNPSYEKVQYLAKDTDPKDTLNYVELGLTVRDENGEFLKDKAVEIHTTDPLQNQDQNGTGSVARIFVDGNKKSVPFYQFVYYFKTPGTHTVIFKCEDQAIEKTFEVTADERP